MNNINPKFCPNCGHKLGANNYNFCPNCHFNLKQYREGIHKNNIVNSQSHIRQQHKCIKPSFKRNHIIVWVASIVIIIIIICVGGYAHKQDSEVGNGNKQVNQSINRSKEHSDHYMKSAKYSNTLLKSIWSQIGTDLNQETSDDDKYSSIAPNFISNNRNKSFKAIYHWLNLIDSSNIEKEINANAKAYDFKDNNSVYPTSVNFKVRYDFKPYHKPDHVQVFNWHASMNKHKIVSMTSQKKPVQNYNKK